MTDTTRDLISMQRAQIVEKKIQELINVFSTDLEDLPLIINSISTTTGCRWLQMKLSKEKLPLFNRDVIEELLEEEVTERTISDYRVVETHDPDYEHYAQYHIVMGVITSLKKMSLTVRIRKQKYAK